MKIRLSRDFITDFETVSFIKDGIHVTGCSRIKCYNIYCKDCELTKRNLNGKTIELDLIRDLIISE